MPALPLQPHDAPYICMLTVHFDEYAALFSQLPATTQYQPTYYYSREVRTAVATLGGLRGWHRLKPDLAVVLVSLLLFYFKNLHTPGMSYMSIKRQHGRHHPRPFCRETTMMIDFSVSPSPLHA